MTAPLFQVISPTVNTTLASTSTPLVVRVWDRGTTIVRAIITIRFPGMQITEVVHNWDDYTEPYQPTSSRIAISDGTLGNGYEYSILRSPIWPDGIELVPFAINTSGEENA